MRSQSPSLSAAFSCSACSRQFLRQDHLKRYSQTHLREKSVKCSYCDKVFSRKRESLFLIIMSFSNLLAAPVRLRRTCSSYVASRIEFSVR
ncbi:hypothetical protein P170DRAFT_469188 [Aspergillus steynii IBT 23096]|uniref:C2H2-type domain-containing protein n=1 Tax=Aspergillus steynii IBT 23096 TaxID=1392250 RepID=A0A2I2GLD8_9EURO|nr:uncharacterized protein P170DRAFT_469188 [Aspergillus steynii IBT 23096]PLB53695.1 hypothetical protein P170DRAFT_469188 [Aspergillus steynii IBT 23096]